MIALLLDQGMPRRTSAQLREIGIDCVHTAEIGASTLQDEQIIALAVSQTRTIVTLDDDFHALLAVSGASAPSVVRVRIEGLKAHAATALIQQVLDACGDDLAAGAAVTVQPGRLRVRRLPLVR
jgi:predicted nuclease of predicted toxin-antitoxin system